MENGVKSACSVLTKCEKCSIIQKTVNLHKKSLNDFSLMRMKKLQKMEDVLLDPLKSKSHMVATDLGNGRFAISF